MTINIPKAELHMHLEGTIQPSLALDLARANGVDLPATFFKTDDYVWQDFLSFLACYDAVCQCLKTGQDYRAITYAYLKDRADSGTVYVEMMISPDIAADLGISYEDMMTGLVQAIDDVEHEFGLTARLIITCVRHKGPEAALHMAQMVMSNLHPYIVGFGMGGDEAAYTYADFKPAFELAGQHDLGLTVHAAEVLGPDSARAALSALPVTRLGHGVRVVEDASLLKQCVTDGIHFEVCPTSNVALNVAGSYETHPLHQLKDAGARFSLNSDDPPFFHTTLEHEYTLAQSHFSMTEADLWAVTIMALQDSFSHHGQTLATQIQSYMSEAHMSEMGHGG